MQFETKSFATNQALNKPSQISAMVMFAFFFYVFTWNIGMLAIAGGAQAVAAMAYGTDSVPKVDKICGPGNQFVTMAKMLVQNDNNAIISIDMPAGPSEIMVKPKINLNLVTKI